MPRRKNGRIIRNKRVLITGGTGSFGSLFVREILDKYSPKEVIVFSRDEDKQGDMRRQYASEPRMRFVLGDVRAFRSIHEALRGIDIVIHAAALKWIPEVEYNVWEGVKTNCIGMQNIIESARHHNVEKVVALSTDKAAEPINAYGMAKALQERLVATANLYNLGVRTKFVSTRYGNVLGSRGSVVPLFRELVKNGKELTVTEPTMTRFIMTLQESVELVLTALEEGVGGEVFVRKMPAHSIGDLADIMASGLPKSKRKVRVVGKRPGEKIHETLISAHEGPHTVNFGKYYIVLPQIKTPEVEKKYRNMKKIGELHYTSQTTSRLKKDELKALLKDEGWV